MSDSYVCRFDDLFSSECRFYLSFYCKIRNDSGRSVNEPRGGPQTLPVM